MAGPTLFPYMGTKDKLASLFCDLAVGEDEDIAAFRCGHSLGGFKTLALHKNLLSQSPQYNAEYEHFVETANSPACVKYREDFAALELSKINNPLRTCIGLGLFFRHRAIFRDIRKQEAQLLRTASIDGPTLSRS